MRERVSPKTLLRNLLSELDQGQKAALFLVFMVSGDVSQTMLQERVGEALAHAVDIAPGGIQLAEGHR